MVEPEIDRVGMLRSHAVNWPMVRERAPDLLSSASLRRPPQLGITRGVGARHQKLYQADIAEMHHRAVGRGELGRGFGFACGNADITSEG